MDKDDKSRYFIVGSIYLEVVTPLFQKKLEEKYKGLNISCLKDFLGSKPVIHILFHLRHRNAWCCTDQANCTNNGALPLNHHQWKQLYTENTGPGIHNCFCKYTVKSIEPADLDLSLCGLILYNCCDLGQFVREAVHILRRNKNDYLSHNTTYGITKDEYGPLMDELTTNILQLDQTKEDELIRIQKRPLDEALCNKYMTTLLDIFGTYEKINTKIEKMYNKIARIEKLLLNGEDRSFNDRLDKQGIKEQTIKPYILGMSIFTLHHEVDLTSEEVYCLRGNVRHMVMMDDGRLVMCLPGKDKLLICNTDGSHAESIHVKGEPWHVTAVKNSTVAVTLYCCVEMYDINNKLKLKSIIVPGMVWGSDITTINNNLVVGGEYSLLIIYHHTGEVIQTIKTDCYPYRLHGSGDKIFYCHSFHNNNNKMLYWYSYTDYRHHTLTLPSPTRRVTTLQDGSMYVVCEDGSVQHVSFDGKQYTTVNTNGLKKLYDLTYNSKQRKLVTKDDKKTIFKVFIE